jgi:Leucine-rich repeat (LRR) protein
LVNLQTLYLSSNHITEIKNLFSLVNLQTLSLSHNQIPNINPALYKFRILF